MDSVFSGVACYPEQVAQGQLASDFPSFTPVFTEGDEYDEPTLARIASEFDEPVDVGAVATYVERLIEGRLAIRHPSDAPLDRLTEGEQVHGADEGEESEEGHGPEEQARAPAPTRIGRAAESARLPSGTNPNMDSAFFNPWAIKEIDQNIRHEKEVEQEIGFVTTVTIKEVD